MGIGDFNEATSAISFDDDQEFMDDEFMDDEFMSDEVDEMSYIEAQQNGVTGMASDSFGYDIDITEEAIPIKFTASPDNPFQYQIWLWLKSIRDKLGGARSWASRNLIQREFERALNQYIEQSGADKVTIDRSEYEDLLSLQRQYGKASSHPVHRNEGTPNPMARMTTQSSLFRQRRLDNSRAPSSSARDEIPDRKAEEKKELLEVQIGKPLKNTQPDISMSGLKECQSPVASNMNRDTGGDMDGSMGDDLNSGDLADIISKSSW